MLAILMFEFYIETGLMKVKKPVCILVDVSLYIEPSSGQTTDLFSFVFIKLVEKT